MLFVPPAPVCGATLNRRFDRQLYQLSLDLSNHLAALLNDIGRLSTSTVPESIVKRMFMYYGALVDQSVSAGSIMATHGLQFSMPSIVRSCHEYVTRAFYFVKNEAQLVEQFRAIWPKVDGVFRRFNLQPELRSRFDNVISAFEEANPSWRRPPDRNTKDIVEAVIPQRHFRPVYDLFYVMFSVFVHGYFEGVPLVIYHDGNTTQFSQGDRVGTLESYLMHQLRIAFQFTALAQVRCQVPAQRKAELLQLFKQYVRIKQRRGFVVAKPFPGVQASLTP